MGRGDRLPRWPSVTVVVPTHDRSTLLATTMRTVLWQRDVDFEVIVVDDGSTDRTAAVVAALEDRRVRLVRHDTPRGVSEARNRGLSEASGEWVGFCDDDDLWAPDKLASQLPAARETDRAWVYTGSVNINAAGRIVGGAPPLPPEEVVRRLPEQDVVPGGASGVLASRTALVEVGGFDPQLQSMADWDLWLRLAATGLPACVARPLVAYRVHAGNMSLNGALVEAEFAVVAARNPRANHAVLYRYLAWWNLRIRKRREALRYFARAAAQHDATYPLRSFLGDVRYFVRTVGEDLRARYAAGLFPTPVDLSGPDEHASWRAEAQAWLDRLERSNG
jgi:glycosyltransferase involved in cell wall biosynthesis